MAVPHFRNVTTAVVWWLVAMGDKKVTMKSVEMPEEMQKAAIEFSIRAIEKYRMEKDIAACIKNEFDRKFEPTWHCVVGKKFGSLVSHDPNKFIYFNVGQTAVLLFRVG
ncbi:dynein light chain 2, cytoplasmic-like [Mercenaria mercenaria]|uniref:dynein light chain 2, cytoplasmic-like n=1 Tax=Mercenaria mercenaria TaxID=6596 RepID=UPI00234EA002|nr:dynein light chain 2, cytoplasmic-like [Mercenaria mercenaria]